MRNEMRQGKHVNYPKDLFDNLPSEIVTDILSRLPVGSIINCKCVQKSWLHLVESREFVKSHLFKSIPGLTICVTLLPNRSNLYKFFKFEDGLDIVHHDLHYKLVAKFNLTDGGMIMGSVDGLLFLCNRRGPNDLRICNPTTRDYINLNFCNSYPKCQSIAYGFGSSKMNGQYKVIIIFQGWGASETECYIYTLGTGSWRRHASSPWLTYSGQGNGLFANGNLHWLAFDVRISQGSPFLQKISCFDLETEHFSTMSAPFPGNGEYYSLSRMSLFALGDCLGLCDNTSTKEIVIWLMKEYGDEKSWSKEFILANSLGHYGLLNMGAYPIKVFKDGDILLQWNAEFIYYSSKTKSTHKVDMFKLPDESYFNSILYTPSFLSLKTFGLDVISF